MYGPIFLPFFTLTSYTHFRYKNTINTLTLTFDKPYPHENSLTITHSHNTGIRNNNFKLLRKLLHTSNSDTGRQNCCYKSEYLTSILETFDHAPKKIPSPRPDSMLSFGKYRHGMCRVRLSILEQHWKVGRGGHAGEMWYLPVLLN